MAGCIAFAGLTIAIGLTLIGLALQLNGQAIEWIFYPLVLSLVVSFVAFLAAQISKPRLPPNGP